MNNSSAFRLQTVLEVREHQERHLQHELIEIGRIQDVENTVLSKLNDEIELAMFEDSTIVRARADEFQNSKAFIDVLSTRIDSQEQKIATIENQKETTRDQLIVKRQSKHMLETLKKSHTAKMKKVEDEKHQKLIDDFGNRAHRRIGE